MQSGLGVTLLCVAVFILYTDSDALVLQCLERWRYGMCFYNVS